MLYDYFSARHPRIRYLDIEQQGWDGYYRKYNSRDQSLALPFLSELKRLCKKQQIPYEIADEHLDGLSQFMVNYFDHNALARDLALDQYTEIKRGDRPGGDADEGNIKLLKVPVTEDSLLSGSQ